MSLIKFEDVCVNSVDNDLVIASRNRVDWMLESIHFRINDQLIVYTLVHASMSRLSIS